MSRINSVDELRSFIINNNIDFSKYLLAEFDIKFKSFEEYGMNDLDLIEMILNIELDCNCIISDLIFDEIINYNPNDFLITIIRKKKLDKIYKNMKKI